ncbi:MAG TPA: signal peptidase I [Verrucomicrobiae bacterium]|nr:signal peptidase I [Verrucomicrobiae bacterium]
MTDNIDFDFAVILTLLTLVTGVVWALDKWWLAPRRRAALPPGAPDQPNGVIDFSRSFFPVILLVLLLRSFLAEPFRIPSGSMIPTLAIGDFILVNKFAYGLRDPVFHTKLLALGAPERGDVVVFRYPVDPSKDFIKRVIGLPGDRIAYRNKQLILNGEPVPLDPMPANTPGYTAEHSPAGMVYHFQESLGAVRHELMVQAGRAAEDFEFEVPEGQYFMMGDNRDGSDDSRRWGTVPEGHLVGRAFLVWMSWDGNRMRPNWSRIGNTIK